MSGDHSLRNRPRCSGVLLHPTSLPGPEGLGTIGAEAVEFLDFLRAAGQSIWQMLPVGPTGYGDSPYQSFSAFAGNSLLISLPKLVDDGLLSSDDLEPPSGPRTEVDFRSVIPLKRRLLHEAFENFRRSARPSVRSQLEQFVDTQPWLANYALFMTLKELHDGVSWLEWEPAARLRDAAEIDRVRREQADRIDYHLFVQWIFRVQWNELHRYAAKLGISLIGDVPIFAALDSADVWANRSLFQLHDDGHPVAVAGVPPDYFSETGQLWGNPLYNWERLQSDDFAWWATVLRSRFNLFDLVRVDHFRGFAAYWAVPAGDTTAINGEWIPAPGQKLFDSLERQLGELPIIAEDLGVITPDVIALKDRFQFPGMKILQFGFDSREENNNLPHAYTENSVVYTGTHDNDTATGWLQAASAADRRKALRYLSSDGTEPHWDFVRGALMSVSRFAIVPMQDIQGLGSTARMNTPGTLGGNWTWRMAPGYAKKGVISRFRGLTELYSRLP